MKLGLPFTSIGESFGMHRTTASRIFYFIISNLLSAMEKWIPEPPTAIVQAAMLLAFGCTTQSVGSLSTVLS